MIYWFKWENSQIMELYNSLVYDETDEIILYRQYSRSIGYGSVERVRKTNYDFLLKNYMNNDFNYSPFFLSKFNGKNYPFFDIDNHNDFNHFISNMKDYNYVVFQSSPGHYWVIVDDEFSDLKTFKLKEIYNKWSVYCDKNYQNLCLEKGKMFIRASYKNLKREPKLIERYGDGFTHNFKIFINKIENFLCNESLQLSLLKYKDKDMLLKMERINKLKRIKNGL